MKILWIPQFSSVRDGKLYITSDSNWNFFINIAKGLKRKAEIILCLPTFSIGDLTEASDFFFENEIIVELFKKTVNVFGSRFDFNFDSACEIIKKIKPDVIFENNPTHVRAWRATGFTGVIATYFHWIDSPLSPKVSPKISYWFRQLEGIESADIVFVNSDFAKTQLKEGILHTLRTPIKAKITKLPPPLDPKIVAAPEKLTNGIVFNHRLSSLYYYRHNFDNLVFLLERFNNEYGFTPTVYFTNPSKKDISDFPFKHEMLLLSLDEYYDFLRGQKVSVAPNLFTESEGMWSIASIEAGACGNVVILPRRFGYKEMSNPDYLGFFNNLVEAYNLFKRCILNVDFRKMLVKEFQKSLEGLYYENIASKLVEEVKQCL